MSRAHPFAPVKSSVASRGCAVGWWVALLWVLLLLVPGARASKHRVRQVAASGMFADLPLRTNRTAGAVGLLGLPKAAASTNQPAAPLGRNMENLDASQKLGVGDRVSYRVLEDQEEPKLLTVTDTGQLDVPELGLVKAAGKTCKELAYEIKTKLEQTTYYHATVILGVDKLNPGMSGRRVYVAGEVLRPGPQEIPGGETWTVSKAIMRAGGFTPYADKRVRVIRGGAKGAPGKSLMVNVGEIWEKGRTELDVPVQPEDVIYVPARVFNWHN